MTIRTWPDQRACSIEVLVVPGCPGAQLALARVQEATESLGVDTTLRVVTVEGEEAARERSFVGSPTVRVAGHDVEDVAGRQVGLACRVYESEAGLEKAPPSAWIRRAIAAWRDPG